MKWSAGNVTFHLPLTSLFYSWQLKSFDFHSNCHWLAHYLASARSEPLSFLIQPLFALDIFEYQTKYPNSSWYVQAWCHCIRVIALVFHRYHVWKGETNLVLENALIKSTWNKDDEYLLILPLIFCSLITFDIVDIILSVSVFVTRWNVGWAEYKLREAFAG